MLFSTLQKKMEILKSAPSLTGQIGRWFLQIIDRDSRNLYTIYPLFLCSDFFISNVWVFFLGAGGHVFLAFYAISNISRNK